jgi:hypothetical protein
MTLLLQLTEGTLFLDAASNPIRQHEPLVDPARPILGMKCALMQKVTALSHFAELYDVILYNNVGR